MSCLLRSLALVSEDNNVAFTSALALRAKASADKSSPEPFSASFSGETTTCPLLWFPADEVEYFSFICSIRSERSSLLRVRSLMMARNSCLRCSSRAVFLGTFTATSLVNALFSPPWFDADASAYLALTSSNRVSLSSWLRLRSLMIDWSSSLLCASTDCCMGPVSTMPSSL